MKPVQPTLHLAALRLPTWAACLALLPLAEQSVAL